MRAGGRRPVDRAAGEVVVAAGTVGGGRLVGDRITQPGRAAEVAVVDADQPVHLECTGAHGPVDRSAGEGADRATGQPGLVGNRIAEEARHPAETDELLQNRAVHLVRAGAGTPVDVAVLIALRPTARSVELRADGSTEEGGRAAQGGVLCLDRGEHDRRSDRGARRRRPGADDVDRPNGHRVGVSLVSPDTVPVSLPSASGPVVGSACQAVPSVEDSKLAAAPPSEPGVKVSVALPLPGVAVRPVGAAGAVAAGVTFSTRELV